jgi:rRNA maturation endonuclease Nob1
LILRVAVSLAVAVGASACGAQPLPFKPVADTKLLMQSVVDPNADVIWEAVKTIITARGSEEIRPRSDAEWTAVRNSAIALAESGNLLMMAPRAKDAGDWMRLSQELIDTSQSAMRAAESKDADRLFTVGGDIYDACSHCHQKYMDAIVNANK